MANEKSGSKVAIVRRVSVKSVLGKKPSIPSDEKPVMLVRFIGVATAMKMGSGDKGEWTALLGSFQAINLATGEIKRAGQCFLPNVALDLIVGQLKSGQANAVEFAFDIGVVKDESSVTGYIYICEPVLAAGENDPLEALLKKTNQAALPAPKKDGKEKAA